MIERRFGRAVNAPAGICIARRATRNMHDAPVARIKTRRRDSRRQHQRRSHIQTDRAADRVHVLALNAAHRLQHARVIDQQNSPGVTDKPGQRAGRNPCAERNRIGEIEFDLLQQVGHFATSTR
jgi:hypothetical protein